MSSTESSPSSNDLGVIPIALKESVRDFKQRMKELKNKKSETDTKEAIADEYEKSFLGATMVRKQTGIVYDDKMCEHGCVWDMGYPEKPERYTAVMERCKELGLIARCQQIMIDDISLEDIAKVHDEEQISLLRQISYNFNVDDAEKQASMHDAIYFNEATYDCAKMACAATVSLAKAIVTGEVQNGMAIVRPPGHHAQKSDYNGYCFFNNVAVAATHLLNKFDMKKILIVDFDVHHGQGTQRIFYEDDRVLYFSIHRYEYGTFWPNLFESSFEFIGKGNGLGYNINVPLNRTGLGDADYMAIVNQILLPVAYEFQPELIIFSAGYDACIGCPEGEMKVSPGFYGHLIKLLSGLAQGRLEVVLEGGYFLPSLAEGAAMTLSALLDDEPAFLEPQQPPHAEVITTITNLKYVLADHWASLSPPPIDNVVNRYDAERINVPKPPYETRDCYPIQSSIEINKFIKIIDTYKLEYGVPKLNKVCYSYHKDMLKHKSDNESIVENPNRLAAVYRRFQELDLDKRCFLIEPKHFNVHSMNSGIHPRDYLENILQDKFEIPEGCTDVYWNGDSKASVLKAVTSMLATTEGVMSGEFTSGVALIRPPGHHAERQAAGGFCIINNVSVAAQYIRDFYDIKRILIVDFDIHHGNGTQQMFYDTNQVLFISIHKYENGAFYPSTKEGDVSKTGEGVGKGYNINIPFDKDKMGDIEYISAFQRIILPVAYAYAPEVIIVSAGFDAGINDLLGNYKVNPETFGHFIQLLRPLAGGKLILAMEGGYNPITLEHSLNFCIKALLGDPLPKLNTKSKINASAMKTFEKVIHTHQIAWPILAIDKSLPH